MGKYSGIIDDLDVLPIADQKYQSKVNEVKIPLTLSASELAEAYTVARATHDAIEAQRYDAQIRVTAIEQLLVESWENDGDGWGAYGAGQNSVRLPDGRTVTVDVQPVGQIEDPDAFMRWCRTPVEFCGICGCGPADVDHRGYESFVNTDKLHDFTPGGGLAHKLTLHNSTMNSMAKERAVTGGAPMPGTKVFRNNKVKLTKAKG